MLNELYNWFNVNIMTINFTKSNIVHFRQVSVSKSDVVITYGVNVLTYTDKNGYLGLTLTDHLDIEVTAKIADHSASPQSCTWLINCPV